jgi:hypothetical protein
MRQVKQESLTNYPVRAVLTYDKYPTKRGTTLLAVSRRDDVKGAAVSRRHSKLSRGQVKART